MRIVRMLVDQVTGHGQRRGQSRRERHNAAKRIFIHQEITGAEGQPVFRHDAAIFKAIFGMQRAMNSAFLAAEIIRCDKYRLAYFQAYVEMRGVLKLVIHVAAQVGYVPAHTERLQRAQHPTRIEFPRVVGVIQVAVRGEIVLWNHRVMLRPDLADQVFGEPYPAVWVNVDTYSCAMQRGAGQVDAVPAAGRLVNHAFLNRVDMRPGGRRWTGQPDAFAAIAVAREAFVGDARTLI